MIAIIVASVLVYLAGSLWLGHVFGSLLEDPDRPWWVP